MAFRIATNVGSINTQRWLGINQAGQGKSLERLSSGYKINKASDDAAGIAIATKLNVKSVSLTKAIDNGNQGVAMLQAAEGGIDALSNILTRLKEIATQSASANTTDRVALDTERGNLEQEIDKVAKNTMYGATQLLQGGANTVTAQGTGIEAADGIAAIDASRASVSAATAATLTVDVTAFTATLSINGTNQTVSYASAPTGYNTKEISFGNLGVKVTINAALTTSISANNSFSITPGTASFDYFLGDSNVAENKVTAAIANFTVASTDVMNQGANGIGTGNIASASAAQLYLDQVDKAIGKLTTERGKLGASMNQLSYHISNLESMNENTKSATSTIKDADFAAEMADFTKSQILTQSGVSMLAQANQMSQQILSLLK